MSYPITDGDATLTSHAQFHNAVVDVKAHYGATGDGVTDDTAAVQAAIDALGANGGTIYFPPGTYLCSTTITIDSNGVRLLGAGRYISRLKVTAVGVNLITLGGAGTTYAPKFENIGFEAGASAGHVFLQDGGIIMGSWRNVYCLQSNGAKRIYDNNDQADYISCLWDDSELTHATGASVSAFRLYSTTGSQNGNTWRNLFCTYSRGTTPFFEIENDNTNHYAYDNRFEAVIGEITTGGLIALKRSFGAVIDQCEVWDGDTNSTNDMIYIGASAGGYTSLSNTVRAYGRRALTLDASDYDIKLGGSNGARRTSIEMPMDATSAVSIIDFNSNDGWYKGIVGTLSNADLVVIENRYTVTMARTTTGNRPAAAAQGLGAQMYDTTLGLPIWSTGSVWKDAAGNTV